MSASVGRGHSRLLAVVLRSEGVGYGEDMCVACPSLNLSSLSCVHLASWQLRTQVGERAWENLCTPWCSPMAHAGHPCLTPTVSHFLIPCDHRIFIPFLRKWKPRFRSQEAGPGSHGTHSPIYPVPSPGEFHPGRVGKGRSRPHPQPPSPPLLSLP